MIIFHTESLHSFVLWMKNFRAWNKKADENIFKGVKLMNKSEKNLKTKMLLFLILKVWNIKFKNLFFVICKENRFVDENHFSWRFSSTCDEDIYGSFSHLLVEMLDIFLYFCFRSFSIILKLVWNLTKILWTKYRVCEIIRD